jgi:GTP-dependent phosphoenolpyruvate carboxykinase
MRALLDVDKAAWIADVADQRKFFAAFDRMPDALVKQQESLLARLKD